MHEMSIAMGMIDELMRIARENNVKKVITVNLKIGKMSGIVTDSLKFAFDAVKLEYPLLSSTAILIDEVPLMYECNNCKNIFSPQDKSALSVHLSGFAEANESPETTEADKTNAIYFLPCPDCKSHNLKLISGEEMHIENLEAEI